MWRSSYILPICLLVFSFAYSGVAKSQSLGSLTSDEKDILTAVGYVGLADFCWAYGIDYRELAHQVKDSIIADAEKEGFRYERLVHVGLEAGARGYIYSRSVDDMINLADSTDTQQACDNMYAQFQRIARLK